MKLDIKNSESPFFGMWLLEKDYCLHNDLFSADLKKKTLIQTGLKLSSVNGFWIHSKSPNPEMSWNQLITFALKILNSEATRLLCNSMWLDEILKKDIANIEPIELPIHSIRVTKRMNVSASWHNVGTDTTTMLTKYKMFGVDTREGIEGTWIHWIAFAAKILSSQNTNVSSPELFCKEMEFDFIK